MLFSFVLIIGDNLSPEALDEKNPVTVMRW